jgi:prepilin peptidase CpaA
MNLVVGVPWWLLTLLGLALCAAAVEDAVRLRISNFTCLAVIFGAMIAMAIHGFPLALWQNAVVFLAILAVGTAAFAANVLGGGDVKLLAAVGLWMNFAGAVWFVAAVLIAGGLVAMFFLVTRPLRRRKRAAGGKRGGAHIPYGIAVAAGALLIFGAQLGLLDSRSSKPDPLHLRPI